MCRAALFVQMHRVPAPQADSATLIKCHSDLGPGAIQVRSAAIRATLQVPHKLYNMKSKPMRSLFALALRPCFAGVSACACGEAIAERCFAATAFLGACRVFCVWWGFHLFPLDKFKIGLCC